MRNRRQDRKLGRAKSSLAVPGILLGAIPPPVGHDVFVPVKELRAEVAEAQRRTRELKRGSR